MFISKIKIFLFIIFIFFLQTINAIYIEKIDRKIERQEKDEFDKEVNAFISAVTEAIHFGEEHNFEQLRRNTFFSFVNHITEIIDFLDKEQSNKLLYLLHEYKKKEIEKYKGLNIYRTIGASLFNTLYANNVILSIIIPVYNNELYLEKCLDSIISQSIKNLEIVCVDDGSTDSSLEILNRYASRYSFIKVITQKKAGSCVARNKAINIASGEFITFMDSDDYFYYPDYLFDCLDYLIRENDVDIVITPCIRERNGKLKFDVIEKVEKCSGMKAAQMYLSRSFGTHASWAKFYRKNIINNVKFIEFGFSQDVMFCANALRNSRRVTVLEYYGYVYFNDNFSSWRPKNITTDHVLSSFRLLLETLNWKYNNELKENPLNIYRFIWIWNYEHGRRISAYIKNGGENNTIGLFFSKIHYATPVLLNLIESDYIKSYIKSIMEQSVPDVELKNKNYNFLFHYISGIDNTFKHELKKINKLKLVTIYISHLGEGGLERMASLLSFILHKLDYQIVFMLDNIKKVKYDYNGFICESNVKTGFVQYLLKKSSFIFDFKYKKPDQNFPFVKYCINNYSYKYIPTIHNTETCNMYFDVIRNYLGKKSNNELFKIICVSEAVKKKFISLYGDSKNLITLHNFVDINKIKESVAIEKGINLEGYYLFAGRLNAVKHKGIDLLLKGFLNSKAAKNNYLVIAGNGKLNETLRNELDESPHKDKVIFLGFRSDIYALMSKAKCLLAPSRWEGFSMSQLESLACGTPVISSRCGGAEELIHHKENGYLFDVEDLESFIEAIDYMDSNAESMRKKCVMSINKFDVNNYLIKMSKILRINKI